MICLRVPTRYICDKKYEQTAQDVKIEKRILAVMLLGGTCGAISFGNREYTNVYNYKHSFCERVLTITASILIGFGVGGFAVLLSPVIVPVGLMVGIVCYSDPPPPSAF